MDRKAAVIRAEMNQTRAELDHKLTLRETRARKLTPRRVWQRKKPAFLWDQVLGGLLTVVGLRIAWRQLCSRTRRARLRSAMAAYERC